MSIQIAIICILLIISGAQFIVIWGLARRIRIQPTQSPAELIPGAGYEPKLTDPAKIDFDWPPDLLSAEHLVVMVTNGCGACSDLINKMTSAPPQIIPIHLVTGANDFLEEYRAKLLEARAHDIVVTQSPLTELEGWGKPIAFPAVFYLRDGVIVKSAHRIDDVV